MCLTQLPHPAETEHMCCLLNEELGVSLWMQQQPARLVILVHPEVFHGTSHHHVRIGM